MTPLKIKVCGMRDPQNIGQISAIMPDFMGFIFYPKSKRVVDENAFIPTTPGVKRVGVFVNETPDKIALLAARFSLDLVQLHGEESPEEVAMIKDCGLGVIKVFGIEEDFSFEKTKAYHEADFFLFDTKSPGYGGTGRPFRWGKLLEYAGDTPYFLSGGLNAQRIPEARNVLQDTPLYGLDINSGAEIAPGMKDPDLVIKIVKSIRQLTQ
jgi:phosphoribosylanthranilate isomerase